MGLGDEVMALGRAARMHADTGRKVVIGPQGARAWSCIFEHAPFLIQPDEAEGDAVRLHDYPGHRPYIDYRHSTPRRQALVQTHRPQPGAIYFSGMENENAQRWLYENFIDPGFVFVATHIKATFSGLNKAWPPEHWKHLVRRLRERGHIVVEVAPPGQSVTANHATIFHDDVRRALALMRYAQVVVTTDGLFHHAAAALGVPAIVLWGARSNPEILGYQEHTNMTNGSNWCGSMSKRCVHCARAMEGIRPDLVVERLEDMEAGTCLHPIE